MNSLKLSSDLLHMHMYVCVLNNLMINFGKETIANNKMFSKDKGFSSEIYK